MEYGKDGEQIDDGHRRKGVDDEGHGFLSARDVVCRVPSQDIVGDEKQTRDQVKPPEQLIIRSEHQGYDADDNGYKHHDIIGP